jgi:hypothetical protein
MSYHGKHERVRCTAKHTDQPSSTSSCLDKLQPRSFAAKPWGYKYTIDRVKPWSRRFKDSFQSSCWQRDVREMRGAREHVTGRASTDTVSYSQLFFFCYTGIILSHYLWYSADRRLGARAGGDSWLSCVRARPSRADGRRKATWHQA